MQHQRGNTASSDDPAVKHLRSKVDTFDWKHDCFLCAKTAESDVRHPERNLVSVVRTLEIRASILNSCAGRADDWTLQVQGRLNTCCDLVAEEAVYHRNCFALFVTSRKPFLEATGHTSLSADRKGRPIDDQMHQNFDALCCWLEDNFDELCSLNELHMKMITIAGSVDTVYSRKHLTRKLIEQYGDNIFSQM